MKKLLVILCTIFFSNNLYAFDFSGTYQGIECRGVCKEDSKLDEFARSLPLIGLFKGNDKIGLLIVEHNESDQTITIFAPRLNYIFADMKLNGNFFKGPATNKSNKNNTIEGNISMEKYLLLKQILNRIGIMLLVLLLEMFNLIILRKNLLSLKKN